MSGRSAYVRKEKTRTKEGDAGHEYDQEYVTKRSEPILESFPTHDGSRHDYDNAQGRKTTKSVSSRGSDDLAYARVKKPVLPPLDVSGIEKSSFRELMDKKSEGVRRGLAGISFGKKKKKSEPPDSRPQTSATIRPTYHEHDAAELETPQPQQRGVHQRENSGDNRPGPPLGKLPPLPPAPQLKRWTGSGRPPHPWNKLRKDPELWDPHGDTLIYLSQESHQAASAPPSFRVSSHVLEATESQYFMRMLREGYRDFYSDSEMPPSPISSAGGYFKQGQRNYRAGHPSSPLSPASENGGRDPEGQISYELYFPAPINQSKTDTLRYHSTTRNIFALLYQASLVGLNLFQALNDLLERLRMYMPPEADSAELIIDYITTKHLDDARNDAETAVSLLVWSEGKLVRWQEGWREFFVHCTGMHNQLESVVERRHISPITKALLERASLEMEVRVQAVADRLQEWNFHDMWPAMTPQPPPERAAFERLRSFLRGFYEESCGSWPPPAPSEDEPWLTRDLVKRLQDDFGALYDYLINREVYWENVEERSTRKWKITTGNSEKLLEIDTADLPMTDILLAFDNRHQYPHIPHPYPLVPRSIPAETRESQYKVNKKTTKQPPVENKMAERRLALAYTEATNIYVLGPDLVANKLADGFVKFEKGDRVSEVDPFAARRGRWVLIYGILQVLASISVDTPGLRYNDDVSYHLSARLRGTPPWKVTNPRVEEAMHEGSYCWLSPKTWSETSESDVPMLDSLSVSPVASPKPWPSKLAVSVPPSVAGSVRSSVSNSAAGKINSKTSLRKSKSSRLPSNSVQSSVAESVRSSIAESTTGTFHSMNSSTNGKSPRIANKKALHWMPPGTVKEVDHLQLPGGYGPGIQKVDEWPIREESMATSISEVGPLTIKDFDDYKF